MFWFGTAFATPINTSGPGGGILNIGGLSIEVEGGATAGCIQFFDTQNPVTNPSPGCAASAGTFTVDGPSDSTLFSAPGTTGSPISNIPQSQSVTNFMVQNGIHFDLLNILPGGTNFCTPSTETGSLPQSCTLPNSPFDFQVKQVSPEEDITVTFSAVLCAYTGSAGTNCSMGTLYTGTFSSTFNGTYVTDAAGHTNNVTLANLISQSQTPFGIIDQVGATLTPERRAGTGHELPPWLRIGRSRYVGSPQKAFVNRFTATDRMREPVR